MNRQLTCGQARDLASEMLDGDVSAEDEAAVRGHVAGCQTCPGLYRAMVEVHQRLQAMADDAIPASLAEGVRWALDHETGR